MKRRKLLITMLVFLFAFYSKPVFCTDQSFTVQLSLALGTTIQYHQGLIFPDTTITGSNINLIVATTDAGAASFDSSGRRNRNLTKSVVETTISLSAPGVAGTIQVNNFTVAGPTRSDNTGHAYGFRVGGTAHILSTSLEGDYEGTATFRVIYN